jgi:hypothetical protein
MPYEGNRSTTKRRKERNAMNEDYIHYDEADEAEDFALKNPLYGWTEEEIKEFLRELYGLDEFYEEDYKRIGRFWEKEKTGQFFIAEKPKKCYN